jgi:hypothetical protein
MKLPIEARIKLLCKVVGDFYKYAHTNEQILPSSITYRVTAPEESTLVKQAARQAAFESLKNSTSSSVRQDKITKLAFDTRRIDQEHDRNPRHNLQYWHRSDPFIDDEDQKKLDIFARLGKILGQLKDKLGTDPQWFESYVRQLHDNVNRILRVKQADMDIFRPQLAYLEQLVYARYRLTMENLEKFSDEQLTESILAKDENLNGKSKFLTTVSKDEKPAALIKDSLTKTTQDSIVNAIFGAPNLRRDGERTVERTITIKIVDSVVD